MNIASRGATMGVDWEQRVDFTRLRGERLRRAKEALEASDLGALLLFDPNNIRYVTSTHIGEWARDKNARYVLLCRGGADPILWDFGSAAKHHKMYAPWLPGGQLPRRRNADARRDAGGHRRAGRARPAASRMSCASTGSRARSSASTLTDMVDARGAPPRGRAHHRRQRR